MSRFIRLNNGDAHHFGEPFTPDIESIASALSHINRFNGHVGQYSVAQHCVLVAMQLPKDLRLSGLLHDAPEAYIGDVTSPLKALLPGYQELENYYHRVIDAHFGVWTQHQAVTEADRRILITEVLSFRLGTRGFPDVEPYDFEIVRQPPDVARDMFLTVYHSLVDTVINSV